MFYFYKYPNQHNIYSLHKFYYEIITVWSKAKAGIKYNNLMLSSAECNEFVTNAPTSFERKIASIYQLFARLTSAQKNRLKRGFESNNNIEVLCNGNVSTSLLTYDMINQIDVKLSKSLYEFGVLMYNEAIKYTGFTDIYGTHKQHFDDFKKYNRSHNRFITVCPFCGINELKSEYHNGKDAYDHYLPKHKYPFTSVNFKNLAPMCDQCNEDNKGLRDPIYDKGDKKFRKAFYPYRKSNLAIIPKLSIDRQCNLLEPQKGQIQVEYKCHKNDEQRITWEKLFGIINRHNATISSNSSIWIENMVMRYHNECKYNSKKRAISFEKFVAREIELLKHQFIYDRNFLRIAFFIELQNSKRLIPQLHNWANP